MPGAAGRPGRCWWPRGVGRWSSGAADASWRAAGILQRAPNVPAPPTRPALRERYERRRQAVLRVAAREFAQRGYHATSMDDLSAATGLAAGGLYHYIGSKEQPLFAILGQLMDPLLERAREVEASAAPPAERLRSLLRIWLAHIADHHDHMLVFTQERRVLERDSRWSGVRESRQAFEEILGRLVAQAAPSGD